MYSLFKAILPVKLKNNLWLRTTKLLHKKLVDQENRMPKIPLKQENIKNLKALANRFDLLDLMPKNGIVAELGVDKGGFSSEILKRTQPERLHLIDVWNTKRYHQGLKNEVQIKFEKEINEQKIILNLGLSTAVVSQFPDNYFDWIYIDTEHSYQVTKEELETYASKMKEGGIIAGHDYINGIWTTMTRYGVIEAVCEFCVKNKWEMIHLTLDFTEPPSFAIRKIQ